MATAPTRTPAAPGRLAGTAPSRTPVFGIVVVGLLACAVAVVIGGAAVAPVAGIADVGAVVRWGLPLIRTVHDVAASVTIGLLVVAAFLLPGKAAPATMLRAGRLAVASGVVWVLAGLVGLVLGFSDFSGTSLDDPAFWAQFQAFVWAVETFRVAIISSLLVAVATTIAAVSLTRKGLAAAAFIALGALLPLALAGHAASSSDHETAVNTIAFHLVGAALWVGGLVAIVMLRPLLGKRLPVVLARYSTMALWCFVTVAISGVVSAVLRLGGLRGLGSLATAYGALVLVKTGCILVLGVFGLLHRRRVVGRIAGDPSVTGLFVRFALLETLVMGVAFGFATALARSASPTSDTPALPTPIQSLTGYPQPAAPTVSSLWTVWRFDWLWGVLAVVAVAAYLVWVLRLHRRGDRWPVTRTISWVVGWAVMFWATCGAPGVLGRVSFSWHMIEHMFIAMGAPVFMALAAPVTLALRGMPPRRDGSLGPRELLLGLTHSRLLRVLGNPVVAAALFFVSLAVFYYSPLFGLALETHTGHVLMTAHFVLTGYLFAWVLIGVDPGPPKWAPSMRLIILLVTISFHAFFGVSLMMGTTVLAPDFFTQFKVSWIPDVLADQQLAGSYAWGIGEVPTLLLAMLVVVAWVRTDATETKRLDRQALRDGGAELAAYNARLSALKEAGAQRLTDPEGADEGELEDHAVKVALIQLAYGDDESVADRVQRVAGLVRDQSGHDLVVLPELWAAGGFDYRHWAERAETTAGAVAEAMSEAARDAGVTLLAGSIVETSPSRGPEGKNLWNTALLFDHTGGLVETYRKIHRFGFGAGEPRLMEAGEELVLADLPVGGGGQNVRAGISTCYDLRFPELYRAQLDHGAKLFVIPAAWPRRRVQHWTLLAHARAIENQCVVIACNTAGTHAGHEMGGHSQVISASGDPLAMAGLGEEVLSVEVDLAAIDLWREQFPVLGDRRLPDHVR